MNSDDFRKHGHELIDWVADYLDGSERYPVLSRSLPGEIRQQLPEHPPRQGEPMASILADFRDIILPGITHWNHPRFFAYFPANNSGPSILGELLSAGLGINAMLWQTSPAATELEETVTAWLAEMLALPHEFQGVIQDTASTATLCALVCARERATSFSINRLGPEGLAGAGALRIYASGEAHSSVLKGARIAGFGSQNVVPVAVNEDLALDPQDLERLIKGDLEAGLIPCCVCATVGTTSSTAIDPLPAMGEIARRHGLWFHVDAALAGSAAIVPEFRWILNGIEAADSFVFNPHKWLLTNFDCSAYFVRDAQHLQQVMAINPEYLKTGQDHQVNNFRDWGIPLGRRFRALKLWFVLRSYGTSGLQELIREHIRLAQLFSRWIREDSQWELLAPVPLNTVCFRWNPGQLMEDNLDSVNQQLMDLTNAEGTTYLTHTKIKGVFALRVAIGQTTTRERHVSEAWSKLKQISRKVSPAGSDS